MKKTQLVKFSLTLVSAAVLAACSSSSKAPAVPEVESPAPDVQAPAAEAPALDKTSSFGHKVVVKKASNLDVGFGLESSSKSSKAVAPMTIPLDPSLDTFVVATDEYQAAGKHVVYLEDFDFRGNKDNSTGTATLYHIHKAGADDSGATHVSNADVGVARTDGKSRTKTALQGEQTGNALVYQNDRLIYISTDETELKHEQLRNRTETVAEVYGNKTFLEGEANGATSAKAQPSYPQHNLANYAVNGTTLSNTPFLHLDPTTKEYTVGGVLNYVQYGRATSKLNGLSLADLRKGIEIDGYDTYVAMYGQYGDDKTENNYFYRSNTAKRTAVDTAALQEYYTNTEGSIKYHGHAVTYGLDHRYREDGVVPNALGADKKLISGTHVEATIDLASKEVKGNLYDVWQAGQYGSNELKHNKLVDFKGHLNPANGAILGTAKHFEAEGVFNANVFGEKSEELGGSIKSKSSEAAETWGAVFGAKAELPTPVIVAPGVAPKGLAEITQGGK